MTSGYGKKMLKAALSKLSPKQKEVPKIPPCTQGTSGYGKNMLETALSKLSPEQKQVPKIPPFAQVESHNKVEKWLENMPSTESSFPRQDQGSDCNLSADDTDKDSDYIPESIESNSSNEREFPMLSNDPGGPVETSDGVADDQGPSKSQLRKAFKNVTVAGDPRIGGVRNYRKPDYCLFCKGKYYSKISSHYLAIHCEEDRVKKIAELAPGNRERKRRLSLLQNEGNHVHNIEVLQHGSGEITVSRRPINKEEARPECYLPCSECFAWIFDKNLCLHSRKCPAGKPCDKNFVRNSKMLLVPFITNESDDVDIDEIFDNMKETKKYPGLREMSQKDSLIREFSRGLLHKLGTQDEQRRKDKNNLRTKIRAVARLLVALNLNLDEGNKKALDYFIKPKHFIFMLVVTTVKQMALSADSPNLALTLGHYIKQLCQLKRSLALRSDDEIGRKEADDFDHLYAAHWNCYVSAVALRRLRLRTLNKSVELPKTSDLVSLKQFLDETIKTALLQKRFTSLEWTEIAQNVMVRIILFNKRRISEVEELKVTEFMERNHSTECGDILSQLDTTEKLLAKRMSVVEVRGKSTRGLRKVFIILSEDMVNICNHLLQTRMHAGISPDNQYMFARKENGPLDGCQAMRIVSRKCPNIENPGLIRTRLLRKYLATTVQILDMTGSELQMVADHMGHSIAVHTDVYRLQSSLLEKTKVARALIALENGKLTKFSGRNLASCTLDEIPIVTDNDEDDDGSWQKHVPTSMETATSADEEEETPSVVLSDFAQNPTQPENMKKQKGQKRKRWERDEEEAIFKAFGNSLSQNKNVTACQIKEAQAQYTCLQSRSIATIRTKVNNILLGKCKHISNNN